MSAVTASILVGTKNRVDLGIQPRWIVLLHEANGYAWHLLRLQLSSADITPAPKFGLRERGAPGTRAGLDAPPGILWRARAGGDVAGELALMLHLHAAHTPEIMAAVQHIDPLAKRRVDLAQLGGRQLGDLANAVRLARETGGGLYLAVTLLAGSRLTEEDLLALPEWEINLATTALSRDWVRVDGGHLEITDYRTVAEPEPPPEPVFGSVAFRAPDGSVYAEYTYGPNGEPTGDDGYVVNLRDRGRPGEPVPPVGVAVTPTTPSAPATSAAPAPPASRERSAAIRQSAAAQSAAQSVAQSAAQSVAQSAARSVPVQPTGTQPGAQSAAAHPAAATDSAAARRPAPAAETVDDGIAPEPQATPLSAAERAHARRFGVRRTGTSGRARVERRERERIAEAAVLPDEDPGLDAGQGPAGGGTWLDTFLSD